MNRGSRNVLWLVASALMLVLTACSEVHTTTGSPPPPAPPPAGSPTTGQVIKGYVQGASVFMDANGNGLQDLGEIVVETDSQGRYTLPAGQSGDIIAIGGVDTVTNVP